MTAHRAITTTLDEAVDDWSWASNLADAVIERIRRMPHNELAELRPDIATQFYILKEQAAQRGQYLLTTLRAHQAAQAQEDQP